MHRMEKESCSNKAVEEKQKKNSSCVMSQNENSLCRGLSESNRIDPQTVLGSRQTDQIILLKSSKNNVNILKERNCKLVPVLEKFDSRFIHCIKKVIYGNLKLDLYATEEKENMLSSVITQKMSLQNLCWESSKMKANKTMLLVPSVLIVKLFNVLEENISEQVLMCVVDNVTKGFPKSNVVKEILDIATDSALTILYILTSPGMPETIYTEVVLNHVAAFLKCEFEVLLSIGSSTKKHGLKKTDSVSCLESGIYNKFEKIVNLFLDLIEDVCLPETVLQCMTSVTVKACCWGAFTAFSQNLIMLLGKIFSRYDNVKLKMLDEVLAACLNIPSTKNHVQASKYQLQSGEEVKMSSILVLHIIQCDMSPFVGYSSQSNVAVTADVVKKLDKVVEMAKYFLSSLIDVSAEKAEGGMGFVEDFVKDMLVMASKPQWPVVEEVLSTLGKLLLSKLPDTTDIAYRMFSLHILCQITVGLKKNAAAFELAPEMKENLKTLFEKQEKCVGSSSEYLLQKVLLGYLSTCTQYDSARNFHLTEWYRDEMHLANATIPDSDEFPECSGLNKKKVSKATDNWKQFLVNQMRKNSCDETVPVTYKVIECICWTLSFARSYSCNISSYIKYILSLLNDDCSAVSKKALKCTAQILESDDNVLPEADFLSVIKLCFLHQSTCMRESAVELVGKVIMLHPEMTEELYDLLVARIMDTSMSVRKHVIRLLKDMCSRNVFPVKVPEMCLKMMKRVRDDESIKKVVVNAFQDLWFTPTEKRESISYRVNTIVNVVSMCDNLELSYLKELFVSIGASQTKVVSSCGKLDVTVGCQQLIETIVEIINADSTEKHKLLKAITALHLLAEVWPQLLVPHAGVLKILLCQQCSVAEDLQITSTVANTFAQMMPFLKNSGDLIERLEEAIETLIGHHNPMVIESCILCLASIVKVTQNVEFVYKYFNRYYTFLSNNFDCTVNQPMSPRVAKCLTFLQYAVFIIGILFKHFDFTDSTIKKCICKETKDRLFHIFIHFIKQNDLVMQKYALKAVGLLCIRDNEFVANIELKMLYTELLKNDRTHISIQTHILKNVEMYLINEEANSLKYKNSTRSGTSKLGSLKVLGDAQSGLATSLIQFLLPEILNLSLCFDLGVRSIVFNIVQLILRQGLVYRPQVITHVIAMTTDVDSFVRCGAEELLKGFGKHIIALQSKFQSGICLSFDLQSILQARDASGPVRGFSLNENIPIAMNNFLYLLVRPSKHFRSAFLSVLVKNFDHTSNSLSRMLYIADNLAHFSYSYQDEVLFLLNNITVVLSVFSASLIKLFNEEVKSVKNTVTGTSGNISVKEIELCVTESTEVLQKFVDASQGCLLLLALKEHLKKLYGISDERLLQYTTSSSTKVYEKVVQKMEKFCFEPVGIIEKLKHTCVLDSNRDSLLEQVLYIKQFLFMYEHEAEKQRDGNDQNDVHAEGANNDPHVDKTQFLMELKDEVTSVPEEKGSITSCYGQRKKGFQKQLVNSEAGNGRKKRKISKEKLVEMKIQ